jgi:hypothetical protein
MVAVQADVIVMTQGCDLEHDKVSNVILCPYYSLGEYKASWEASLRHRGENPTPKAWRRHCDTIREGFVWSLAMLNPSEDADFGGEHRIVDFHDVFSIPRTFIESLLSERGQTRQRLLPPYREHLSQAFARFFMRVGLPTPVTRAW